MHLEMFKRLITNRNSRKVSVLMQINVKKRINVDGLRHSWFKARSIFLRSRRSGFHTMLLEMLMILYSLYSLCVCVNDAPWHNKCKKESLISEEIHPKRHLSSVSWNVQNLWRNTATKLMRRLNVSAQTWSREVLFSTI